MQTNPVYGWTLQNFWIYWFVERRCSISIRMEMSSCSYSFHHWLHGKLSKWQFPVQLMTKIAVLIRGHKMVGIQQSTTKSQAGLESSIMTISTHFEINPLSGLSKNTQKPQKWNGQMDGWTDEQAHSYVHLHWQGQQTWLRRDWKVSNLLLSLSLEGLSFHRDNIPWWRLKSILLQNPHMRKKFHLMIPQLWHICENLYGIAENRIAAVQNFHAIWNADEKA